MPGCEIVGPKVEPKKDLVFVPPLHSKPHEAVSDYFVSKLFKERPRKKPVWDWARVGPELGLLTAKRDMENAKIELEEKRSYQKEKRVEMDELWKELKRKEDALRKSFITYNKFIKENHEKRERAREKIKEEERQQERRLAELQEIKDKADDLTRIKQSMEEHVNRLQMYQEFMERVVEECPEFKSVHDILDRYATLFKTRIDLARRQDIDLQNLEKVRKELMLILEEKSKALMGYNNQLADLWIRYDKAHLEDLTWESLVVQMQNEALEKVREWGAMRLLCWRLYKLICYVRIEPTVYGPEQIDELLLFIQHNFLQLQAITRKARHNAAGDIAKPLEAIDSQPRTIILTEGP